MRVTLTTRMDPKLKKRLQQCAKASKLSVGYLIERAVEQALVGWGKKATLATRAK